MTIKDTQLSNAAASAQANAITALMNGGHFELFDNAKPANANAAAGMAPIVSMPAQSPAAPAAVNGVATFTPLTLGTATATTTGATWFRGYAADGSVVWDGTVGGLGSGANMEMNSTAIQSGSFVGANTVTFTALKAVSGI